MKAHINPVIAWMKTAMHLVTTLMMSQCQVHLICTEGPTSYEVGQNDVLFGRLWRLQKEKKMAFFPWWLEAEEIFINKVNTVNEITT